MKIDLGSLPGRLGKKLQSVFGSANQRALTRFQPTLDKINELSDWADGMDQEQIRARVREWREKVEGGQASLDDALPEMFAMTRRAAIESIGLRHFDVQLIGGMVMHSGGIAEMVTGEGKTLVATLPAALNAINHGGVYVVTVNDYLAKRDRDWMAPVFEYLGLSVGAIQSNMGPSERQEQYACDIIYGTNNEFGFDYLRDNMKWRPEEQVQKRMHFAIIDEVDSILIDEARTPLIISGPPEGKAEKHLKADRVARALKEDEHFEIKLKEQQVLLTDAGTEKAEQLAGVGSFYGDPNNMEWPHLIEQSLRAHHIYERDKNYVVAQNEKSGQVEVIIVDEFTGRLMAGRRWSDGLHQAVEAKEGLRPQEESQVLATITLQNYFRMFDKLAGMTGTAMTEAAEFSKIYDLDVVSIPTNKEMRREDADDLVYLDEDDKMDAIVELIREDHERGRPILVGTTSIANSEKISDRLSAAGIRHEVLNAKHHAREAEIIAQAGRKGAVTVATNMAGRGTDIVLGGNPKMIVEHEARSKSWEVDSPEAAARLAELEVACKAEQKEVLDLGGLLVIGTERHEARRIDNQLRGRCGRQGDPGKTMFYLCFDDDLMRIFARDWVKTMMQRLGLKKGEVIESGMVTRGIERAQKKVEQRNFDIRKNLLEYDEVMDKQRKFIYVQRQEVLEKDGLRDKILGMFEEVIGANLDEYASNKDEPVHFDEIETFLRHKVGDIVDLDGLRDVGRDELFEWINDRIRAAIQRRSEEVGPDDWEKLEQFLLLDTIDNKWKDHLYAMEVLKHGIGLRGYAQIDPKNEYKKEGFEKFKQLKHEIAEHVTNLVFRVDVEKAPVPVAPRRAAPPPQLPPDPVTAQAMVEAMVAAGQAPPEVAEAIAKGAKVQVRPRGGARPAAPARPVERKPESQPTPQAAPGGKRPGRNDPCPCGSGIKYKKCCAPAFG
ncbi:MAG: preprotein translocase subunit SecA [Planctomycetes bacterium]|nr:preprotein translocase subunit SecA [Planctomycetota bacterium]